MSAMRNECAVDDKTAGRQPIEFMGRSLDSKLEMIRDEIAIVQKALEERKSIHDSLEETLYRHINGQRAEKDMLGGWKYGSVLNGRVAVLEKELDDFERERRIETVSFWRDRSRLQESMRTLLRESWAIIKKKEQLKDYLGVEL